MPDSRKNDDLWAQLLGAARTEAAKQADVTKPDTAPVAPATDDPWAQLMTAAEAEADRRPGGKQPDPSATAPEGTEPDPPATVPEGTKPYPSATVPEGAAASPEGRPSVSFEKGAMLLGTYRIESDPIHGGMGSVWRVRHTGWNTDLAMKRPQPRMFATEASKHGFIGECRNWINLGLHPNIVSCYYVREIGGVPAIFSEWMENGSLKDRIGDGSLYEGEDKEVSARLLDIAIQYARGLHYAHEAGLIHQDVKPDNLLLTKDWQAKAADFGLANARAQLTVLEGDPTLPDPGQTLNAAAGGYTPAYCSMEQMDGKTLTRRTDIYSWAVSVMETYVGSRPWQNGVVAGAGCRGYMSESRVPVPEALQDLLAKCMETDVDNRPHDFAVIEEELRRIYRETAGREYPRPEPKAAADTADSLNNRALSALDLGETAGAERYWNAALDADPHFAEAVYNRGLYRWRTGKITDSELLDELEQFSRNTGIPADKYISAVRSERAEAGRLYTEDASDQACGVYEGAPLDQLASGDGSRRLIRRRGAFTLADRSGRELRRYETPELDYACAISPDGSTVFYAFRDTAGPARDIRLHIHRPDSGTEETFPIRGVPKLAEVKALALTPDCRRIFVGTDMGQVIVLDRNGTERERHNLDKWLTCMYADPETGRVAAGAYSLYLFDREGQLIRRFCGHGSPVHSVFVRGGRLVSATTKRIGIWDTETGQCLLSEEVSGLDSFDAAWLEGADRLHALQLREHTEYAFSESGKRAAYSVSRPQAAADRTESDERFAALCARAEAAIAGGDAAGALQALDEARRIGGYERNPRLTDLNEQAGRLCRRRGIRGCVSNPADTKVLGSPSLIFRACFSRDMESIYLKKDTNEIDDGTVARYSPSWERLAESGAYSTGAILCEAGGFVAVAGLYGAVHLLDAKSMERIRSFDYPMRTAPRLEVTAMCASGDRFMAVSRINGRIDVFDLPAQKVICTIEAGLGEKAVLDMSPDESLLMAADGGSRILRAWRIPGGEEAYSVRAGDACLGPGLENAGDTGISEARFTDDPDTALFTLSVPHVLYTGAGGFLHGNLDKYRAVCRINLKTGEETVISSLTALRKLTPVAGRTWWAGIHSRTASVVLFNPDDPAFAYSFEPVPKEYFSEEILYPSASPDGRYLLASGAIRRRNGMIRRWEIDWIYEA
ncbi:MAG: protein kinase [Clostridia bacterium]|nr:protein kinase [Clostridia bacterium]